MEGATFKAAVTWLLNAGVYPSPVMIQRHLGRQETGNLNGKECQWRNAVWVPWMKKNPDHPITLERNKRRIKSGTEIDQLHNEDAIAGLIEIVADLADLEHNGGRSIGVIG